jgi:phospholipase C
MKQTRRGVLGLAAAALAAEAFNATIARALQIPANARTGTIHDVEHVVILMQENRSFDHYFGSMRGVRGFGDPRAITLPGGAPVWRQPDGHSGYVAPFRLDARRTSAEGMHSLDHSWKGSHALWKNHDAWIPAKSAMTMGHFTREDLPFYYALADAFTICDAYYCSIWGPTNPNRQFLFTGTSGLAVGQSGPLTVRNPLLELNETPDLARDNGLFKGFEWTTYAERLQSAGVSWKVYQEYDNYGDNALTYFKSFRGSPNAALRERARSWAAGSTPQNASASRGEHLVADFAADVGAGRLPAVSWLVAPYIMCEHPSAGPSYGQSLTARLLEALVANPEVWSKTVFILNYDENDGFFDHVPPPIPAVGTALGASTLHVNAETFRGEPVGLGPRVPMIAVSPWSKGGWVNSQTFDHTSVLQFLEKRFGVAEPNITPWRRVVCGDLTSVFDFASPDANAVTLPATNAYIASADAAASLPAPVIPATFAAAHQEAGQRPARALPYDLHTECEVDTLRRSVTIAIDNRGAAGAALAARSSGGGPWFFTVESTEQLRHELFSGVERYDFALFGPNGFYRAYRGSVLANAPRLAVQLAYGSADQTLRIQLRNNGGESTVYRLTPRAYVDNPAFEATLAPGAVATATLPLAQSAHWYDFEITTPADPSFGQRFAGHVETGQPSLSDPLLGAA